MKLAIRDLLFATTAVAILLTFAQLAFAGFLIAFALVNALLIFLPFAVVFTTIIFADQRGQMLDLNSNPLYKTLKKIWLLSIVCVLVVWLVFLVAPFVT
ncbi:MAG: hypothetical protein Aurels2KO_46050 [Aureliella sp.]